MGCIVAIAGGDNGWGNSCYETGLADKAIVELTYKKTPRLLFIGFAAKEPEEYYKTICKIFAKYNCQFEHLNVDACKNRYAETMIKSADIIYVGGGNTYKLMRNIKKYKLDSLLADTYYSRNVVLCGVSAGAICWCKYGNSATRFKGDVCAPIRIKGIDLVNVLYCPHSTRDFFRSQTTKDMLRRTPRLIGLEMDFSAIVIDENQFRIIPLNEKAVAKKKYWVGGTYYSKNLQYQKKLDVKELYKLDGKEE